MDDTLQFTVVAAPLVVGWVATLRATPLLSGRRAEWAGLVSLLSGVLLGVGWQTWGEVFASSTFLAGVSGAVAGLTASGLWSTSKASVSASRDR